MVNGIGGLASGIDTLSLLDEMMKAASVPLESLKDKKSLLEIKKDTFVDVNDQLAELKRYLIELRLESTFKSKNVSSSDDTVVTGTATTGANAGSHTISISQLATSATARSIYSNSVLVPNPPNSTGLTSVSGRPDENLEGRYAVTIADAGSYYTATAVFTPSSGGTLRTLSGATTGVESTTLAGAIGNTIAAGDTLIMTVGSDSITVSLAGATADSTMMSQVAADLGDKINTALNTARDTTGVTYVAVRNTGNTGGANNDGFVIYSTNNEALAVTGGTAQADLGYGAGGTQSTSQTISNTVSANTLEALLGNMNDKVRGLIRGVTFTENTTTGLTTGSAQVDINSELSVLGGTPTYVYGGLDVATGASLNTTISGLNNAGFSTTITGVTSGGVTSGVFTINGISINLSNYATLKVNDVLGLINSSAAGVTATYDSATDSFLLTSNVDGSYSISLGDNGDTSNFLTAAKLTYATGASISYGNSKGSLNTTAVLSSAGFSRTPTSGTFTINDTTLYVDVSSDTISTLIQKINNSNAGVTAGYDAVTDKFTLSTDQGEVSTNTNKITVGDTSDTSNILNVLNLQDDFYTTLSGTALATNRSADQILIAPPTGTGITLAVPATTGTGAYQASPATVNWIDGIKAGGTFTVLAGAAGATEYKWTNNSGDVIRDIDTFVTEWNKSTNWSSSNVEVGVIKESETELRFFSRSMGATAEFTITAHSAYDMYELGFVAAIPSELSATDNSPEGVWHFNEGTGTAAADATANANDGLVSGAAWVEGDFFGTSLDFDGTDDYVEVTGSASLDLNGSSNFTIEAWIKPDTYGGGNAVILDKAGVTISIDNSQKIFATINGSVSGVATVQTTVQLPATFNDKWYHIAVVYDDTEPLLQDKTKIYINGVDQTDNTTSTVSGTVVDVLATDMYIGNDTAGGGGNPFDGRIDEVGFYKDTAKTSVQLLADALANPNYRSANITNGMNANADAEYNALNLAYAINGNPSAGIWATTDSSGGIDLTSKTLGYYGYFGLADEDTATPLVDTIADFFASTPINSTYNEDLAIGIAGEDASFTVDNINYVRTSNTVDDVIGGVTLKLRNTSATNVILDIEVDTEKGIEKLTDFIVSYNKTLELMNPPMLSEFQKGYLNPLSAEEEEALTTREIEIYEGMHKTYNSYKFIQSESSFRRLYEYFRLTTTANVEGFSENFDSITDLNIIPGLLGTDEDARKGYLIAAPNTGADYREYIKEALENNYALLDALVNHSDEIYTLFANDSTVSGGSDGLSRILTDKIDTYINTGGILKRQIIAFGVIDKDIALLDDQITRWEDRLARKEEYYWRKFMKMEEAIANLSRQGEQLANMLKNIEGSNSNS